MQLSWSVISDILSRLAESIGDNNEDVQVFILKHFSFMKNDCVKTWRHLFTKFEIV